MKILNSQRAVVDLKKLQDYCLSPKHSQGKHKAHVFESALNLTAEDSEELKNILLVAVQTYDATPTKQNEYGQSYIIDFTITKADKQAVVRSAWIIRHEEDFPRLTTCYVL
ncbi:hypothetical protein WA1_37210 [Scytonema hofmannii PCC 7110]|uniref:DUF6883 domain-containing protein n=1 Tax=Scytonema hofmannii PCC 7110 TaxID=128403 RepID=A0A139X161_9CYAN|nr:DUF6883 domain-containing protein [Scytonema hofmannii]KYC38418.1 hypothetical protein WA1_37210 [Scytonema hofmannii PCC 7110]